MFRVFEGSDADTVWREIASAFRDPGEARIQASRAGVTREILHAMISITDPRQRWVVSRIPPLNPAYAVAQVIWTLAGRNDAEFVNYFNRQLPKYAGFEPSYHGAYGFRLRRHRGVDQLDRAYDALKGKPDSRQIVLQMWDSEIDLPGPGGQEVALDVPCNVMSMLKLREGRLEWMQISRSNDTYLGLPYDIVEFTVLQEVVAGWLGVQLGSYHHLSDSLHVYIDCPCGGAEETLDAPPSTDSLAFPRAESERWFSVLERHTELLIGESESEEGIVAMARRAELPQSLRNILCILCAESARRRRLEKAVVEVMEGCTNPAYRELFARWSARVRRTDSV